MTRLFNALVWLLPLGLCGCPSNETCNPGTGSTPEVPIALLVVGEPVKMTLTPFGSGGNCAPTDVLPENLTVEITGPDGQPVPNEASVGRPHSILGTIQFTPEKPGRHHFFAAFEPVGGIQQFDLQAARDRSAEAPLTIVPDACHILERTDHGSLVCNSRVFQAGQFLPLTLPPGRVAVSGNVVWVAGDTRIQRYVDSGTKFELSANLSHTLGPAGFLLASSDELLVLYPQSLQRITFDGTALVSTQLMAWPETRLPIHGSGLQGILLRAGSRLALVTLAPASEELQACAYQLDAAGLVRTGEPCQLLSSVLMGYERSVLWTATASADMSALETLHRMEWTGTRLEPRGSLFVGPSLEFSSSEARQSASVPVLRGATFEVRGLPIRAGVPVYLPAEDLLSLEVLDVEDLTLPRASSTFFWGTPPSGGGSRVRLRPSTP